MISLNLMILLLICASIYFVLGAFWYNPFGFGRMWMKAVGLTSETMDPNHNMVKAMLVSYLVCFAQSFVIAMVISHLKVQMIIYSAVMGAIIALAFGLLSAARAYLCEAEYGPNEYRPWLRYRWWGHYRWFCHLVAWRLGISLGQRQKAYRAVGTPVACA